MNKKELGKKLRELGYEPHEMGEPNLGWTPDSLYCIVKGDNVWFFDTAEQIETWLKEEIE